MNEPKRTPARTWLLVGVGLAVAWIVYLILFGPRSGNFGDLPVPELKAPTPAAVATPGWVLRDLQGAPVPLEKYLGKPIFLNIWATWCPPCVAELPAIANLAGNPRLKDVTFLCASAGESPEVVRSFLEGKNWPMTVLTAEDIPPPFATEGIPATFVIAPDGRVVVAEVGSAQWDAPSVVEFLERLAGKKEKEAGAAEASKRPAGDSPPDQSPPTGQPQ